MLLRLIIASSDFEWCGVTSLEKKIYTCQWHSKALNTCIIINMKSYIYEFMMHILMVVTPCTIINVSGYGFTENKLYLPPFNI